MNKNKKLWGGRFSEPSNEKFFRFNRSFDFDQRLFEADIKGSLAYCRGLERANVLTKEESKKIQNGLNKILKKSFVDKNFLADTAAEDVHAFIEKNLIKEIGDAGKKLHTGRSRNDQVATALRIWMRDAIDESIKALRDLQKKLIHTAEENIALVIPGYTHMQKAQPVLFAHWCLAYFEMLRRDSERFLEARKRVNVLPLGSAALAGTSYKIDRNRVARELNFEGVSRNSMDAVSDRDFCTDFVYTSAMVMTHLSRFAEDIILYSTSEFGFFELSDAVATGSSIMPQKKNPDSMELVRGKTGRVFGDLVNLLTMLKSLPLAYNKDMQEDKEAVFNAFDTLQGCLEISSIVIRNIRLDKTKANYAVSNGFLNATELADYLARKGVPFRDAHELTGKIVLKALEKGIELEEFDLEELREYSDKIDKDVFGELSIRSALETKSAFGGTSPKRVKESIKEAKKYLQI